MDNVFQSNCSSHAELLINLRKIEKRPKIRHKAVLHPALQLKPVPGYVFTTACDKNLMYTKEQKADILALLCGTKFVLVRVL